MKETIAERKLRQQEKYETEMQIAKLFAGPMGLGVAFPSLKLTQPLMQKVRQTVKDTNATSA